MTSGRSTSARSTSARSAARAGAALAEPWLAAYGRLTARAAHEVNNALNGVAMNLEVVRLRARPGGDAGALATFAEGAAAEQGAVEHLVAALVGLGRAPRAPEQGTDVREVCGHAAALFAPVVRHAGLTLRAELGDRPAPTAAPAHAVRLAVCLALEAGTSRAAARAEREAALAADPSTELRCTLLVSNEPVVDVAPAPGGWTPDVVAALADAGVRVDHGTDRVRLVFPPL